MGSRYCYASSFRKKSNYLIYKEAYIKFYEFFNIKLLTLFFYYSYDL